MRMMQVFQKQGGVIQANPRSDKNKISDFGSTIFLSAVKRCQPFVFAPSNKPLSDSPIYSKSEVCSIDSPFNCFSIEILGGPVTSPRFFDDAQIYTDCIMVVEPDRDDDDYLILFVLGRVGDNDYLLMEVISQIELGKNETVDFKIFPGTSQEETITQTWHYLPIVKTLVDRFNNESVGTELVKKQIRLKRGDTKVKHSISKVIHVTPKNLRSNYASTNSISIDWSHRWFSRGHWRQLKAGSLGKNRIGEYVESGRTWVTESVKGPEDKPLVSNKVRLVDR